MQPTEGRNRHSGFPSNGEAARSSLRDQLLDTLMQISPQLLAWGKKDGFSLQDVEDAIQNTVVDILQSQSQSVVLNSEGLIFRIFCCRLADLGRLRSRLRFVPLTNDVGGRDHGVEQIDNQDTLKATWSKLPHILLAKEIMIIKLRLVCGDNFETIAAGLGMKANTTCQTFQRALQKIRKAFLDELSAHSPDKPSPTPSSVTDTPCAEASPARQGCQDALENLK